MRSNLNKNNIFAFFILIVIALAYVLLSQVFSGNILKTSFYPYYTYLSESLSVGRLDINPYITHDLSLFEGKYYLNWGIGPVFLILPFIKLSLGSDIFYTLFFGICNIFLFYFLIKEVAAYFKIELSTFSKSFLLLCFAFISPNLYLSLAGRIWHTEKILSAFYLLLFLLFFFKYLNSNYKNLMFLIVSIIFFNLAWLSRLPLIFYCLLLIYPVINLKKDHYNLKRFLGITFCISAFCLGMFFSYNYIRFSNPVQTGLMYHVPAARYEEAVKNNKFFSISYIGHNINYYFLNSIIIISNDKPFYLDFNLDPEGNSIFSLYPFLLLLPFIFKKKIRSNKKKLYFLSLSSLVIFLEIALITLYFSTGWMQLGSRYFMDILPLILLLLILVIEEIRRPIVLIILIYGIAVNLYGVILYYKLVPV